MTATSPSLPPSETLAFSAVIGREQHDDAAPVHAAGSTVQALAAQELRRDGGAACRRRRRDEVQELALARAARARNLDAPHGPPGLVQAVRSLAGGRRFAKQPRASRRPGSSVLTSTRDSPTTALVRLPSSVGARRHVRGPGHGDVGTFEQRRRRRSRAAEGLHEDERSRQPLDRALGAAFAGAGRRVRLADVSHGHRDHAVVAEARGPHLCRPRRPDSARSSGVGRRRRRAAYCD